VIGTDHHPAALYFFSPGSGHSRKAAHENRQKGNQQNQSFEFLQQVSLPCLLHLWLKLLQYGRDEILSLMTPAPGRFIQKMNRGKLEILRRRILSL